MPLDPQKRKDRISSISKASIWTLGYKGRIIRKYVKKSDETIIDKTGDCKAHSVTMLDCLKPTGYQADIMSIDYHSPKGHTVCRVAMPEGFYTLDSIKNLRGPFKSPTEIKMDQGYSRNVDVLYENSWQTINRRIRNAHS